MAKFKVGDRIVTKSGTHGKVLTVLDNNYYAVQFDGREVSKVHESVMKAENSCAVNSNNPIVQRALNARTACNGALVVGKKYKIKSGIPLDGKDASGKFFTLHRIGKKFGNGFILIGDVEGIGKDEYLHSNDLVENSASGEVVENKADYRVYVDAWGSKWFYGPNVSWFSGSAKDMDRVEKETKRFGTKEEAVAYAKKMGKSFEVQNSAAGEVVENSKPELANAFGRMMDVAWKDAQEDIKSRRSAYMTFDKKCEQAIVEYWKATGRY